MACTLVPIDLSDPTEWEELRQQRLLCGWDNTTEKLTLWRRKQEAGLKSFFWIVIPSCHPSQDGDLTSIRGGHISLDAYAEPTDWDLANAEKTNLTIQTFYILPEYRTRGVGRSAMKQIEALATAKPYGSVNCQYITLNCLSKKHYYDEFLGPIVKKVMPICNQEWYEKQGYVVWKEEPRYEDTLPDKTTFVFDAAFMRKRVIRG
ncbi:hypothetical protein BDW62DRAFT_190083 [Aspergillus aurantiobrunneus]